jgi:hypothetical protein
MAEGEKNPQITVMDVNTQTIFVLKLQSLFIQP